MKKNLLKYMPELMKVDHRSDYSETLHSSAEIFQSHAPSVIGCDFAHPSDVGLMSVEDALKIINNIDRFFKHTSAKRWVRRMRKLLQEG